MDPSFKAIDTMSQAPPKDLLGATSPGVETSAGATPTSQDGEEVGSDAEGVWAPDIEQAFQEALAIYPPCGRRKIILSDEGKMYGRNELIARYIKLRTGKQRTRKQVSSHIQVLARKKAREIQGKIKVYNDQAAKDKALAGLSTMSSAQIVSASVLQNTASARMFGTPGIAGSAVPMHTMLNSPGAVQGQNSPVVVKNELINPVGLIWPPHVGAVSGQPFIPSSMVSGSHTPSSPLTGGVGTMQFLSPHHHHQQQQQHTPPTGGGATEDTAMAATPQVVTNPALVDQVVSPNIPPPNLPLKMVEFMAFVEKSKAESDADSPHEFVNIGPSTSFVDPNMEAVDVRHIADKFPEKNGGLKDLFEKGPQDRFFLVKFWADINTPLLDDIETSFFGVTSQYESSDNMTISCSTKVCSFGKQVVEKVETEYARFDKGRFVYRISRSPMCEYMTSFIRRLKHLPEKFMMNSVLENFTILQVVTNRETQETLLCLACVFEVVTNTDGPKHRVYRLIKEN